MYVDDSDHSFRRTDSSETYSLYPSRMSTGTIIMDLNRLIMVPVSDSPTTTMALPRNTASTNVSQSGSPSRPARICVMS